MRANAEVLGKGTFGTSYKLNLKIGPLVVKKLNNVKYSEKKFIKMLDKIGKINHANLLPLKACQYGSQGKIIVYDYMPMGSLSALLQRNRGAGNEKTPLNWDIMFGIVLGIASAIAHLHAQGPTTFHGNIKPSNILLTERLEARVSDYLPNNIAEPKYIESDEAYCSSNMNNNGKVSQKADVYNFGVVLLEFLTGKTPIVRDELTSEKVTLRRWILSVVENELTSEVFDLDLLRCENVEEDLLHMLQIAIDCTSHDLLSRPSMEEVRSLEELKSMRYTN